MFSGRVRLLCAAVVMVVWAPCAFAQNSAQLTGIVVDAAGAVTPGASVIVRNNATGEVFESTSNQAGAFSVPAIAVGTYTVTVTLQGFKTAVINNVRVITATPASVTAVLEVGSLNESVEVKAGSELVQTQSTAITSSISVEQISDLPLTSRNALYFASMLPGAETPFGTNVGARQSTFSGLPQNTINITMDGVTTGNQLLSIDGFFSMVTPRLDAVEEFTVTSATPAAGLAPGAVQIAFTTRSGSNTFNNSLYHYFKHPALNSNSYFNKINGLEKNEVIVHQYGARSGGPLVIPGLFNGRDRAFYFLNFEHQYQPSEATRTRTILNPDAQRGIFSYLATVDGVPTTRSVDLFDLAGRNGQTSTPDPTIQALLAKIRTAAGTTGTISTPVNATNTESYVYQAAARSNQYAPSARLDINATDTHRISGTYHWQRLLAKPDLTNNSEAVFPGFAAQSFTTSYRTVGSLGLRSTFGSNMVNELRGGWHWSPNAFSGNVHAGMFDDQGGFRFDFPSLVTDPTVTSHNSPAPRNTTNWNVDNTFNWLAGAHTLSFGASFMRLTHNQNLANLVPTLTFAVDPSAANDPATLMFNTTNFLNAPTTALTDARNLYAILTGRVTQIAGTARLDAATGQYVYLGNLFQRARMSTVSLFGHDSWRWTPTVTLDYGLRWDLQLPFTPLTNTWSRASLEDVCGMSGIGSGPAGRECNLFKPGTLAGGADFVTTYERFTPGTNAYKVDWNNLAPNVGIAWRPDVERGVLRTLLGDPEQATVRAAYSVSYVLERLDRFFAQYSLNPGGETAATRNYTTGFPLGPGPVLLRDRNRLGAPAFDTAPQYPIRAKTADPVNILAPDLETPRVQSFSVGLQRSIGQDTAVEVRYVGNRLGSSWATEDWNEEVLFENGFIDEFRRAQANLASHVAAGCQGGCSFAYRGPGSGTSPLPIYLAYFQGLNASRATDETAYGSTFRNPAWTAHLGYHEPDPDDAANDLHANPTFRANAIAAGLAPNFFEMNPSVAAANVTRSAASSRYDSMQLEMRRRLAQGLLLSANYTYARRYETALQSVRLDRVRLNATRVPHSFKMNWLYEIPFGQGRRFGSSSNGVVNAILGDWEFSGTGRLQTQQYTTSDGALFGMTHDELQDAFKVRTVRSNTGTITVFSFPQDIVDNTRRAFSTDPTSTTGYGAEGPPAGRYIGPASTEGCVAIYRGDCGAPREIVLHGPLVSRFDMRLKKRFPFGRRAFFELDFEVQNVFDAINFTHVFDPTPTLAADTFRVTSAYMDINTTFDPGGRLGQIVWRFSW